MQHVVDTGKILRGGWLTPHQLADFYNGVTEALFSQTGLFAALGNLSLVTGFAVLISVPLAWTMIRLNRG